LVVDRWLLATESAVMVAFKIVAVVVFLIAACATGALLGLQYARARWARGD
jgi:hypothetical protein